MPQHEYAFQNNFWKGFARQAGKPLLYLQLSYNLALA